MTAEIRVTRKGIIFFLVLNIILMYIISGKGCSNKNDGNSGGSTSGTIPDINHLPQQSVVIQPIHQTEEIHNIGGQGQAVIDNTIVYEVHQKNDADNLPMIYTITPTYARELQKAELTRCVRSR